MSILESRRDYVTRCDRCSSCKWVPGMPSERFASICPSIDYGKWHSYSGSGRSITAFALMEKRLGYSAKMLDSIFTCTACGGCDTACKWNHADVVEPLDTIYALRAQVVEDGRQLPAHAALIQTIRTCGNRYGLPRAGRTEWARDLALKQAGRDPVEVLLHIGCANAYQLSQWKELRFIVGLLRKAGVSFGVLGDQEPDCGGLVFDLGCQREAEQLARENANLIRQSGAKTVVTCSAEAYAAFRNVYPRLGVSLGAVRLQHITEAVEEWLAAGRLSVAWSHAEGQVTFHDSCKLGRLSEPFQPWQGQWVRALNQINVPEPPKPVLFGNGGLYDAPRRLLERVGRGRLVEMQRIRQFAYCCGAAGGAREANPAFAAHAAHERLEEVRATGASTLISACGTCTAHLREVAAEAGMTVEVKGLFEYLAEAEGDAAERPT